MRSSRTAAGGASTRCTAGRIRRTLAAQVAADFREVSHDLVRYRIVETTVVDAYPWFTNGLQYNDESYTGEWEARTPVTGGDFAFDYARFVADNGIGPRIDRGEFDEVWVYTFPYSGMYESRLLGPGG
jgi:hypothetical protein